MGLLAQLELIAAAGAFATEDERHQLADDVAGWIETNGGYSSVLLWRDITERINWEKVSVGRPAAWHLAESKG